MQTKNQKRQFGFISLSVAFLLSFVIISCSKSDQIPSVQNTEAVSSTAEEEGNAAYTYQGQQSFLFHETIWEACANNGVGENITLDGYVHFTYKITTNNDHYTLVTQLNFNEISGVGLTTGNKYVASGGGQEVYSGSLINGQSIATGSSRFLLTAAGTGNTQTIVYKARYIVNANGEVSSQLLDFTNTCK